MFVRWQEYKSRAKSRRLRAFRKKHGQHRLRAILVETVRIDGKPHQRYLAVQSRSVMESAMLMLHSGRPYGTDSSRQRQDHARRPSCYTAIEGFDPRARQPL